MIKLLDILKEITHPSPQDISYHFTTPVEILGELIIKEK